MKWPGRPVRSSFSMRCLGRQLPMLALLALFAYACERDDGRFEKRAELPLGNLDVPNTSMLELGPAAPLTLSGWAVSEDGIAEVNAYVDRRLARSSGALLQRPDVATAFPAIPGSGRSGFQIVLEPAEIGPGPHEIVLQVRTNRNAVRELGRLTVVAHP